MIHHSDARTSDSEAGANDTDERRNGWTRRHALRAIFIGGAAALAAACTPAPPPVSTPVPAPPTKPAPQPTAATAKPAAAAPTLAPTAKPAAPAQAAGAVTPDEWQKILAAARQEGRVVVMGPQGNEIRDALTIPFQQAYPGIEVDYSSLAGDQVAAKLIPEVSTGKPLTDLVINGTTPTIPSLMPAGAVVPVRPYLVGPNSADDTRWRNGKRDWGDDAEQFSLLFSLYVKAPFVYSEEHASPSDFKSWKDLLDPKWKGRMAMRNPQGAGGGQAQATFWYSTPTLGKEFLDTFFKQMEVTLSNDDRQVLDGVARGRYAIGIGASDLLINEFIRQGLPLKQLQPETMEEGTYVTPGNGTIAVVKSLPHPNALKVYLDWFFSRDGQYEWSKAAGFASLRQDVPRDHVPEIFVPKPNGKYAETYKERYLKLRDEVIQYLKPATL